MKLTAIDSAGKHSRMARLKRLQRKLETNKVAPSISAIHDHKGTLCVNWTCRPAPSDLVVVTDLWAREGEHASNHYVNDVQLVGDVGGMNPFGVQVES
jgi:hypothetical protein